MAGVPVRAEAVNEAVDTLFGKVPIAFPPCLEVALDYPKTFDAEAHKGALKRVSPPEEFFAFLKRMEKDLKKGGRRVGQGHP